uniref:AB hydrolase-1 domain-containing protein n=1 Tax=Anopheles atroparvus TaxID=41427 RepID=A0A182JGI9_ANOAO
MRLLATVAAHLRKHIKTTPSTSSSCRCPPLVSFLRSMCNTGSAAKERQLQIGSDAVHFVEAGQGDRGIILLPGALGTAWTDFKPQIERLPALLPQYRLIAWDPPGYGKSRPPDKEFPVDFYERDATAAGTLMQKLGFERYSILGWSDGGITGLILAANQQKQVDRLVIWGSNSYISDTEAKIYEDIRDVQKWSARMREPMEKVYGVDHFPKLWAAWVDGLIRIYHERKGDICNEKLKHIKAPTLVVHGAKDPMIIPDHVPYLLNNIKNSDLHVFPDGKHNIHLRYADEFNNIVAKFLRDHRT